MADVEPVKEQEPGRESGAHGGEQRTKQSLSFYALAVGVVVFLFLQGVLWQQAAGVYQTQANEAAAYKSITDKSDDDFAKYVDEQVKEAKDSDVDVTLPTVVADNAGTWQGLAPFVILYTYALVFGAVWYGYGVTKEKIDYKWGWAQLIASVAGLIQGIGLYIFVGNNFKALHPDNIASLKTTILGATLGPGLIGLTIAGVIAANANKGKPA